jgi:rubrerythrin
VNFGLEKQIERLIEVTALAALLGASKDKPYFQEKYGKKLMAHAFPEEIDLKEWTCPVCLHTSLDDECPKCNSTGVYLDLEIDANKNGHLPGCVCEECE